MQDIYVNTNYYSNILFDPFIITGSHVNFNDFNDSIIV